MHVAIGTAGHIDHGKSTLVATLTGQTMDRLPEEKRRGITVVLGFASWKLDAEVEASLVDVPGHEKLVHTMVAGAWGLDLMLLVVAADEGVMPQTREHLAVGRLLGVRGLVVALTKVDRVDDELVQLATADIREHLAAAGLDAAVPVVPVSAQTGHGLEALRAAVVAAVRGLPPRPADGVAFLPVDRVFSIKGFGTVVTGTLSGGTLTQDATVDVHPGPKAVRIRGLQCHGQPATQATPGWRVAVNLPGVAVEDIPRGAVLAPAGQLVPSARLEVLLHTLPGAPLLKDHASVMVHIGADSVTARLRCVFATPGTPAVVEPDAPQLVQLVLARPLATRPGQRFILRGHRRLPGAGSTFGGGQILDPAAPLRRRGRPETLAAAAVLLDGDADARVVQAVADAGVAGADLAALGRRLPVANLARRLEDAVGRGRLKRTRVAQADRFHHPHRLATLATLIKRRVTQHHKDHPTSAHMPLEELRSVLLVDGQPLERARFEALLRLVCGADLVVAQDGIRLATHKPAGANRALLEQVRAAHLQAGLAPPTRADLLKLPQAQPAALAAVLRTLVEGGELVRVKDDLHFAAAPYQQLVERTVDHLQAHPNITTQQFKELMGGSRKYVIPFLEHLDETRVTLRVGEKRVLRRR